MSRVARLLPGVIGAGLVCAGLWLIFPPAAVIVAGLFLLAVDRLMP